MRLDEIANKILQDRVGLSFNSDTATINMCPESFMACIKGAMAYADTCGDYGTARRAVAKLSGIPPMAISFDEHIERIEAALQGMGKVEERCKKLEKALLSENKHIECPECGFDTSRIQLRAGDVCTECDGVLQAHGDCLVCNKCGEEIPAE